MADQGVRLEVISVQNESGGRTVRRGETCGRISALGGCIVWTVLLAVALIALTELWKVLSTEGVRDGLVHPVLWHKLAELLLIWTVLSRRRRGVQPSPATRRVLGFVVIVLSCAAWWQLRERTPWSWWCLCIAALATPMALAPEAPTLRHPILRTSLGVLVTLGYGLAAVLGYAIGTAHCWYPVLPATAPPAETGPARWAQDLHYLRDALERLHVDAFHAISAAEFDSALAELKARLPQLDDSRIAIEIARLVARIGDAHTGTNAALPPLQRFPLYVRWFGDELRVIYTTDRTSRAFGARLVSIDDMPISDVQKLTREVIAHEDVVWADRLGSKLICLSDFLHGLGVLTSPERGRLGFLDVDGRPFVLELDSAPTAETLFNPSPYEAKRFQYTHPGETTWFETLDDGRTWYLRYASCEQNFSVRSVARAMFKNFDEAGGERLVIDLRQNTGGSELPFSYFVIPLLEARFASDDPDRLFVLIDGGTYSSGVGIARQLQQRTHATFVGMPTGGVTNGYGEVRSFRLPNSGMVVSYSTQGPDPAQAPTDRVTPDIEIPLTYQDYVTARDACLEWILSREN